MSREKRKQDLRAATYKILHGRWLRKSAWTSCIELKAHAESPSETHDSEGNLKTPDNRTAATRKQRHTSDISSFPRNKPELGVDPIPIITALAGTWICKRVEVAGGKAAVNNSLNAGGGGRRVGDGKRR